MRFLRLILAALAGILVLVVGGVFAVGILALGLIGFLITRFVGKGHFRVDVQRGGAPRTSRPAARMSGSDAIDIEATPVGSEAKPPAALPEDRPHTR